MSTKPTTPDLNELIELFYSRQEQLGTFVEASADSLPEPYRGLLAHNKHMTVTVESFHNSSVDVLVLEKNISADSYARKILLARQSDRAVVQYGIMRIHFQFVKPEVRAEIESEKTPLGRILIEHNVLRQVELVSLWKVQPGAELQQLFGMETESPIYGRTALIHVNEKPAVELLEIVTGS